MPADNNELVAALSVVPSDGRPTTLAEGSKHTPSIVRIKG